MREVNIGPASEIADPGRKLVGFENFEVAILLDDPAQPVDDVRSPCDADRVWGFVTPVGLVLVSHG